MKKNYFLSALFSLAVLGLHAQERTVTRVATQNATVYFENQENANGQAERMLLSGVSGSNAAILLQFDLSDFPANADVKEVRMTLNFETSATTSIQTRLAQIMESWSAGSANPSDVTVGVAASNGDATWNHSSYPTEWTEGTILEAVAPLNEHVNTSMLSSSSTVLSATSSNAPEFEDWVKDWIADPSQNFGFAVVTTSGESAQMHSSESSSQSMRPTLEITYEGDPPSSVENHVQAEDIRIFPNPAQHNLNVTGLTENVTSIEIMDISGRVLRSIPQGALNTVNTEINISDLSSGTYFLKVNGETGHAVKTFIVK